MFNVAPETLTVDYRNRTAGVEELREALGVRFVINGNVESLGSLVRITVRLVSSATKETLWTEKFDGEVNDLFKDLDGIIQSIVGHLLGAYRSSVLRESKLRVENDADNLGIDDYLLCGFYYWHRCTAEANAKARRMFEKAFELAPNSSGPCQALAWCRSQEVRFAWCEDPGKALTLAHDMARRALVLDETHFESHWVLGHVSLLKRDYEIALTEFQNALQLSPDVPHLIADFSDFMVYLGKPQDALAYINRAVTLNPYYPDWYAGIMARANADVGNIEAAADIYHSISTTSEDYRLEFTALLVQLSRLEEAWIEAKQQLQNHPDFSLKRYAELYSWKHPYRDRKRAEEKLERHLHSLRMAGLPG
jgi:adenylate cyclase